MYCEHFGLTLPPFNNTPDPRFFFNTPDHEEALASLQYAVEQRKGFVLVTGEVGSGKTLISRMLLARLNRHVRTAVITNTRLSAMDLLVAICREFEVEVREGASHSDLSHALQEFLLEQYSRDRLAVVILDEAQNLPMDSLEELRMLGNLEADDAKLLQVVILGQPELQEAFRHPSLRQTYQRIFRTFHLKALSAELTAGYIAHRLAVAGLREPGSVFLKGAVQAIYRHSEGIPRLINQICDNAMIAAYGETAGHIGADLIEEVIEQMMALNATRDQTRPASELVRATIGVSADGSGPGTNRDATLHELIARIAAMEDTLRRAGRTPDEPADTHADIGESTALIRSLVDRCSGLESELAALKSWRATAGECPADSEQVRRMHEDTATQLHAVSRWASDAQRELQQLLQRAEKAAGSIESRALVSVNEADRQTAQLAARAQKTLADVEAFTQSHQTRLNQVLTQSRTEIDAVRELRTQASDLYRKITVSHEESERRIRQVVQDATGALGRMQNQGDQFLTEARQQAESLQGQLRAMIDETRVKGDASVHRAAELLAQQHKEFDSARQHIDEFTANLAQRSAALDREAGDATEALKRQGHAAVEAIHAIRHRIEARADQVNKHTEEFAREIETRVETSKEKLDKLMRTAEDEVHQSCQSLKTARERVLSEAEQSRSQASLLLSQTQSLLNDTRDQCNQILGELRVRSEAQRVEFDRLWKTSEEEGSRTLSALNEALQRSRQSADQSRAELEAVIRKVGSELFNARSSLEGRLREHKSDLAKLSADADSLGANFRDRFEQTRHHLDGMLSRHRAETAARIGRISEESDAALSEAETAARRRVAGLNDELLGMAKGAERIGADLRNAIDQAERNADGCLARFDAATNGVQEELAAIIEANRMALREGRTQMTALTQQAKETVEKLQGESKTIVGSATSDTGRIARALAETIERAQHRADELGQRTGQLASSLETHLATTRRQVEESIAEADRVSLDLRRQGKSALSEVRECLTQMNERADVVRRELALMGEDIRTASASGVEQLERTGERVANHIDSMRESARADADAQHKRLAGLKQQVELSAEKMRQNAAALLDQVQTGTASLRQHADELLLQAQSGAEKLSESAAQILVQAQTTSDRLREQAETMLHKAETTVGQVRGEVQSLKTQLVADRETIEEQTTGARRELAEARSEAASIVTQASDISRQTQAEAEAMLRRAEDIQKKSESLLAMPRELIAEAQRQATAITQLSKKVATVVKQLAAQGGKAQAQKDLLDEVGEETDRKLSELRSHTERVGQLVGIIRQLYGAMDARIERLRGRLTQADDLFRTVPRELESLRSVLNDGDGDGLAVVAAASRGKARTGQIPRDALSQTEGLTTQPRRSAGGVITATASSAKAGTAVAEPRNAVPSAPGRRPATSAKTASTLGEIVQRNQKLNDWLNQMLAADIANAGTQQNPKNADAKKPNGRKP